MSKLNFDDIQEHYETALTEKKVNTHDVNTAIVDNDLNTKFISIQKEREQISSFEDLEKYQKKVKSFFDEVYKIITAPGVQKFVDWINELSLKGIETKISTHITDFLIGEYATYDENIKNIIKNKAVLEPNSSLFENIKKSVRENINKRILSSLLNKEKINDELPDFIEELDDLLEKISEINELGFQDAKDFYTNNIDDKDLNDYIPEIDQDADFFYILIKQIIEKKDFLTTNQDLIKLSTIAEAIENSLVDIKQSIEKLKSINIQDETDNNVRTLYNKFEKNLVFDTEKNNISGYLEKEIFGTWETVISAYHYCQNFYRNHPIEKIQKLEGSKSKWLDLSIAGKIEQYILTLNNIVSDNPEKAINGSDISKIKNNYTKAEKAIKTLEESSLKEDIVNYFQTITSDYEGKKIEILKKLKIESSEVEKIKSAVDEINRFIDNIKESENLLEALNVDFVNGILESYEYIKKEFTAAIEKSDIKDDLGFLDGIYSDGYQLNKSELDTNLERFKRLLEYDLININLTKNI